MPLHRLHKCILADTPYFFHWANYIVGLDFTWMGHHRRTRKTSLLHHWQLWHPQDKYRILAARVLKPVFYTGFRGPEKFQREFGNLKNILEAMAPHSSTLAWKIPWMEEPGRLQSMGSLRVGHDWATSLSLFTFMHWRRKWQPTPVFLPGESQGRGSLVGCRLWGRTESDTTEAT